MRVLVLQRTGERTIAPKRVFILLEDYDETLYGPYKPEEVKPRKIEGAMRNGIYRLAAGERKGVYHVENYDEMAVEKETVEDDGSVTLFAGQQQQKYDRMASQLEAKAVVTLSRIAHGHICLDCHIISSHIVARRPWSHMPRLSHYSSS